MNDWRPLCNLGDRSAPLVIAFAYDPSSNLLSPTDAKNGVTHYIYDGKNRVATRKDPLLWQESFQYDGKDNLTQSTDRKVIGDVAGKFGFWSGANLLTGLGIDETLLRTDSAGPRSFLTDGLGSTLAITDSAGLVQGE